MDTRNKVDINLSFTADTAKARKELNDLQKDLSNLINNVNKNNSQLSLSEDLKKASTAAATLKEQLRAATDVNTGKLDLGKFTQSMKQSRYSIQEYKKALVSLGPEGAQSFSKLAQAITTAEVPLKRTSVLMQKLGTTLANTVRWQISSSALNAFIGSIRTAYHYAEDLNESLNNIRIVTGQNVDQMAKFAADANKAAQALNTTTTEYTNASLIFYQQGKVNLSLV